MLAALPLLVVGLAVAGAEPAEEQPAPPDETGEAVEEPYVKAARAAGDEQPVKVYTNEDLRRLTGGGDIADSGSATDASVQPSGPKPAARKPAPTGSTPTGDPLAWLNEQQQSEADRQQARAAAEQRVAAAQERIAQLEKRLLATRNPLLARPQVSDEKAGEWEAMSAPERVNRTQRDLDEARQALTEAQQELNRLR